ncbi:glutamate--tRNA ligase [Magnetospirillum gryphiswaldense]|uniref:Glutamate--tRNA ligase n=1 Tax=Magnetospirillum gryphiswaldense TaxID=55518 RepID=A4TUF2_9PROT|nr:glutamate--tRNA ligase [Magnetospirillum gryphiswaldense]AVM74215.1 Glutamate--tRNA ligase 1 [Magnetospirillum gryphiswaldense MSR-1]AVM78118.1 Glutamate--tRNA ligase 1 [Magnetospirillum gryphiswaldense]CAM74259.1 Glutamyl-tRNA synthetase [Magnetospirillum gryphiswaldense MSR-1]
MTVTVRFAPSPTGLLHVGNARVALINWLFAKAHGGYFMLRYDDTDLARSTDAFAQGIARDLSWLGLAWDKKAWQSKRLDMYTAAAERLKADGRLYACWETPEELDFKRKRQLARGLPPVYDRAGLHVTAADRAKFQAEGRQPHWRFKLDHKDVRWDDLVRGDSHVNCASLSDPVLIRADGTYLYTLPSVVDDIEFAISHIIRGEDHVTNSAPQIQLFRALGAEPPAFAHLPLLTDISGAGLSKRLGSLSLADLREQGTEPMAVNSLLAKLGTSDAIEIRAVLDQLVDEFDITHFSRSTAKFDPNELAHLNAKLLHGLSFDQVAPRLAALGLDGVHAGFWDAVKANLASIGDAAQWWPVVTGPIDPVIEDVAFCAQAAAVLPDGTWDQTTWGAWTNAVKQATGRKGRELFHPLRLALTGRENGPELKLLLPLIGRDKALARLSGQAA